MANASGNILDDEELINALALSKTTSTAINGRLTEAEATTQESTRPARLPSRGYTAP